MPGLEALQAYQHYLTAYSKKSSSRQDLHDKKKLREISGSIQKKNAFSPVYLEKPTPEEILDTLALKEQVYSYHQDIARLYENHPADPFMQKIPYTSNEQLCEVSLSSNDIPSSTPHTLNIEVMRFACAQTNVGAMLPATQKVDLPNASYSFDMEIKNLTYEFQFDVYEDDTNQELQNRISNLINRSNLGLHSVVLSDGKTSSLCLVSDAIGKPAAKEQHFSLSEAPLTDYLGLNQNIRLPQNAQIAYDGQTFESFHNHFQLLDSYEIQLTPSSGQETGLPVSIEIGFYPDIESLTRNIEAFVNGYNQLYEDVTKSGASNILPELNRIINAKKEALSGFGIQKNFDGTLCFVPPQEWNVKNADIADTSLLTDLGNQISKKLMDVCVDPMLHMNRRVGIYTNPIKKPELIRPYLNFYAGLLFHKSV